MKGGGGGGGGGGGMHVVVNWEQPIYTSCMWLTLTDVTTFILTFHTVFTYQIMFYSRRTSIHIMGVDTV